MKFCENISSKGGIKMNKLKLQVTIFLALILVLTLAFFDYAKAAENKHRELKLAHFFPPTSNQHQLFEDWAKRIEAGTNGQVKILIYPGATLVPPMETWNAITVGACDIGCAFANMHRAGFKFNTSQLFFWVGSPSIEFAMRHMDKFRKKYPILEKEFAEAKILWRGAIGPRQLFTSRKAIRSLEDMKGLQIRAATPGDAKVLKAVGAVAPAFVPMSEVYMSLQKRIFDGLWSPTQTLKSFRLAEVVKYVTKMDFEVGHNKYVAMNWGVWNSLSPDIQKVFNKESAWAKAEDIRIWTEDDEIGVEYAKSKGIDFIELSAEDFAKLMAIIVPIQDGIAADLNAKGFPGSALLKDIRVAISRARQK
jgi:TRAP-type C4-dicarboxylate transport system substrate-binding protein